MHRLTTHNVRAILRQGGRFQGYVIEPLCKSSLQHDATRSYHISMLNHKKSKNGWLQNEEFRKSNILKVDEGENPEVDGYKFSDEFLNSITKTYKGSESKDVPPEEAVSEYGYKKMSEHLPERGSAPYSHKELNQFHDMLNRGITFSMDDDPKDMLKGGKNASSHIKNDMSGVRVFMPKARGVGEVSSVDDMLNESGNSIKVLSDSRFESREDLEKYLEKEDISKEEREDLQNLLAMESELRKQYEQSPARFSIVTDQSYSTNWWKVFFYLFVSSYIGLYVLVNVSDSNRLVIYEPLRDHILLKLGITPPQKSKGAIQPKTKTKFVKEDGDEGNVYVKKTENE